MSKITTETYIDEIEARSYADGILIQLPVTPEANKHRVLNSIPRDKDVEGLSAQRMGELAQGNNPIYSPVAKAAMHAVGQALSTLGREAQTQHVCLVGFSDMIGKPLAHIIARQFNSTTICTSKTTDLRKHTSNADILISGIGKPAYITQDMIKPDSILIDAGYETDASNNISGDFHKSCLDSAAFFTPVPGGIGPLTITYIYENLLELNNEHKL